MRLTDLGGHSGEVDHGDPSLLLPVDSMRGFRQGDALAPEWGAQVLMRTAVSFLEAGVFFFVARTVTQRAEVPRISSSRAVRIIVAPTRTTKERNRCVPGEQ